jgi:hypothetical protein
MSQLMTIEELEVRMGRTFVEPELAQMTAALSDISDEIVAVVAPLLDDATPATTNGGIKQIITNVLSRWSANPNGLTGENLGDYGWQSSGGTTIASITDAEWRRIRRILGIPTLSANDLTTYSAIPFYYDREGTIYNA